MEMEEKDSKKTRKSLNKQKRKGIQQVKTKRR